jgi:hypothetical protein
MKWRTNVPRLGLVSTMPMASSSRSASRTGAWLVPYSSAILVSTRRSPGASSPETMRRTSWSRIIRLSVTLGSGCVSVMASSANLSGA